MWTLFSESAWWACCTRGDNAQSWVGVGAGFSALFLTRVRGYSLEKAGGILAISGVVGFSGAMLVPVVSDLVGRRGTVFTCASVGGLFALGDLAASGLILARTPVNFCMTLEVDHEYDRQSCPSVATPTDTQSKSSTRAC
jgi:hypothetical protein